MELWKDIKGYEGMYQVSNYGNVRSLDRYDSIGRFKTGTILSEGDNGNGYKNVQLYKDGQGRMYYVHRLVAEAFIPNPDNLPQVNHMDEDKSNNCVTNLEWCTNEYNSNYGNHNLKLSLAHKGKVLSEEHKKNIGKASKALWQDENYRAKVLASKEGFTHTEETKKKMSEKAKKNKVRCIETGEVFDSMKAAGERYNRNSANLSKAIRKNSLFAGYHWELVK
jgi:hypothetical protein